MTRFETLPTGAHFVRVEPGPQPVCIKEAPDMVTATFYSRDHEGNLTGGGGYFIPTPLPHTLVIEINVNA